MAAGQQVATPDRDAIALPSDGRRFIPEADITPGALVGREARRGYVCSSGYCAGTAGPPEYGRNGETGWPTLVSPHKRRDCRHVCLHLRTKVSTDDAFALVMPERTPTRCSQHMEAWTIRLNREQKLRPFWA